MPQAQDKSAIRRRLREIRRAHAAAARRTASQALVRLALRHRLLAKGRRVGLYIPSNSEIDVHPLLSRARAMGSSCFLPIVPRPGRKRMWFSEMGPYPIWVLNRYGIPENRHPLAKRVRAQRLDLLFMPLLGFDSRGFRLGMGGGYYDASLAYLKRFRHWKKPRVVGVAFSDQEVEYLPNDVWDIPLDAVLTEREYCVFPREPT
ncbi:MAG: 5-formyltetrahydrofolate cyclo-ligase [Pseudomonadota bacterium]|nr:5-formyltetrahydrofolate cyclo-ligase [Pseudomonadota bacterium]MDP1906070.1 5-formyltetrahydrofolate cyclo-ligase [Pseudomonadota bacterium]MDP2353146.1 5-formyltetrahydrofolate cyclo-ligase [Pseudomonadota bacterium]